jgi:hypothetical protein
MKHPVDQLLEQRRLEEIEMQARSDSVLRNLHQPFQSEYIRDVCEVAKREWLDERVFGESLAAQAERERLEAERAKILAEEDRVRRVVAELEMRRHAQRTKIGEYEGLGIL